MLPNHPEIEHDLLEDLTKAEIRLRIAQPVGLRTDYHSAFGKKDLNSIYAYLTGEHYFPKRDYNTPQSPDIEELRVQVAIRTPINAYILTPDDIADGLTQPERVYRKAELIELCEAVEQSSDQRPYTAEAGEEPA